MVDGGRGFPNWLLDSVEPPVRARFRSKLRRVGLAKGEMLTRQGETIEAVHFPEGALIGLLTTTAGGERVQTAMVGWDGAVGVFEACGSRKGAFDAEVQSEGPASRIGAGDYRQLYEASENLRTHVHKYVEMLLAEARQNVACNTLHSVESRLSRSILEALERSRDGRTLPITQHALAEMLGVQRTTVTAALAAIQRTGAVRAARGVLTVTDTAALERVACGCRETLQAARGEIYASRAAVCD